MEEYDHDIRVFTGKYKRADEVGELAGSSPLIDEFWNEIDTWLNGEYEAWLECAAKTE